MCVCIYTYMCPVHRYVNDPYVCVRIACQVAVVVCCTCFIFNFVMMVIIMSKFTHFQLYHISDITVDDIYVANQTCIDIYSTEAGKEK